MNLVDYGRVLWRRGWLILLLAAIAAGSAYYLSARETPVWRATQRVLVRPIRADLGLTESATRLLNQYAAYLDSEITAQRVIDTLQLDMTAPDLKSKVTIAPIQISLQIQIDVDMTDQQTAGDIAREWGMELKRFRDRENQEARREDRIEAELQDNPQISLLRPRPTINAVAGGVLGLLLGGILIFVLEYLESNIVRRREDIEAMGLPLIGAIPRMDSPRKG
jgi:capsular polysaccharide biosynthesis protein